MKSWRNEKQIYQDIEDMQTSGTLRLSVQVPPMPEVVSQWLSSLILLGEVPLAYLVVDEREMPVESIRFFNIDPHWTQALVDGATSIGALTKQQAVRSKKNLPMHYKQAKSKVRIGRYSKMHPNHQRDNLRMTTDSNTPMSGFIMRSSLVSNWNGIEVKGFLGETQQDILRMERMSDKVLICIFEGEIDTVRMYEPKEVLHFGTRSADRKIDVRRIDEGHEGEPLYKDGTKEKVTIMVPETEDGRLKVNDLRNMLATELKVTSEEMQSPQLALEMLSVAGQCVFERGAAK